MVTHGTLKTFKHWLPIVEIKLKGQLSCKYNGQSISAMVGWHML